MNQPEDWEDERLTEQDDWEVQECDY